MYERFTDTARKAMQLSNQVAQRYNHQYIGTEHILLGIVEEGAGVAVRVLNTLDVELERIAPEVEKIVQHGLDPMTMDKLPQTPRAKKIIEYALEEARNLDHNYVGTEHLLLGLIRETEGVAGHVLHKFGVRIDDVRREIVKLNVREPGAADPRESEDLTAFQGGARGLGRFVGQVARAIGLGHRSGVRSAIIPVDQNELEQEIERLTVAKEEAVANQDFKRAAQLRDQVDELKRKRIR